MSEQKSPFEIAQYFRTKNQKSARFKYELAEEIRSYALSVAREAVEEEKGKWVDEKVLIACNRILTRSESKLNK